MFNGQSGTIKVIMTALSFAIGEGRIQSLILLYDVGYFQSLQQFCQLPSIIYYYPCNDVSMQLQGAQLWGLGISAPSPTFPLSTQLQPDLNLTSLLPLLFQYHILSLLQFHRLICAHVYQSYHLVSSSSIR